MPTPEDPKFQSDESFEQSLRKFRPLAPMPLRITQSRPPWLALATVAALILVAIIFVGRNRQPSLIAQPPDAPALVEDNFRPVTAGDCEIALRQGDENLSALLDEASPQILPQGQPGTLLYELGKE